MSIRKESKWRPSEVPLPGDWFRAYLEANRQFALLPPAIDAVVGLAVVDRIARGEASWQMLPRTGFSENQIRQVEHDMTKLHLAHGIPLVGESMTRHHHHGTARARAILEKFTGHHGRPLRTDVYHGDTHAGHAVVNRSIVSKTWGGIAGETARAAVYFARATGFEDKTISQIQEHKRTRENFLRRSVVQALDRYFQSSEWSGVVGALRGLYGAAVGYIGSDRASEVAADHRRKFNLHHAEGTTPFYVTGELRTFAEEMGVAVRTRAASMKSEGVLGRNVDVEPFIQELQKHGRLT